MTAPHVLHDAPVTGWAPGLCRLCRRTGLPVTWLGPACHGAVHAPFTACEPCTEWLAATILAHHRTPAPAPGPDPGPGPGPEP